MQYALCGLCASALLWGFSLPYGMKISIAEIGRAAKYAKNNLTNHAIRALRPLRLCSPMRFFSPYGIKISIAEIGRAAKYAALSTHKTSINYTQ
jgi:hypothetical protein